MLASLLALLLVIVPVVPSEPPPILAESAGGTAALVVGAAPAAGAVRRRPRRVRPRHRRSSGCRRNEARMLLAARRPTAGAPGRVPAADSPGRRPAGPRRRQGRYRGHDRGRRVRGRRARRDLRLSVAPDEQALAFESAVWSAMARAGEPIDRAEAEARMARFVAPPGHSQHQLGTAIDFSTWEINYAVQPTFAETEAGRWLEANAWQFGFVLSYTRQGEERSGYAYEPWHYRWIGRDLAAVLQRDGYHGPPDADRRRLPAGRRGAAGVRGHPVNPGRQPSPDDRRLNSRPLPTADSAPFRPFHAWITALAGLAFMGNGLDLALVSFSLPGMRAELGLSAGRGRLHPADGRDRPACRRHRRRLAGRPDRPPAGVRADRLHGRARHRPGVARDQPGRVRRCCCSSAVLGIGGVAPAASALLSELAPPTHRGRMMAWTQVFWVAGWSIAATLGGWFEAALGWRGILAIGGLPAVLAIVSWLVVPESPRYLVARGHHDRARRARRAPGEPPRRPHPGHRPPGDAAAARAGMSLWAQLATIWGPGLWRRTFALWTTWMAMNAVFSGPIYMLPVVLEGIGAPNPLQLSAYVGYAMVPASFISVLAIDRSGRRPLMIGSLLLAGVGALVVALGSSPLAVVAGRRRAGGRRARRLAGRAGLGLGAVPDPPAGHGGRLGGRRLAARLDLGAAGHRPVADALRQPHGRAAAVRRGAVRGRCLRHHLRRRDGQPVARRPDPPELGDPPAASAGTAAACSGPAARSGSRRRGRRERRVGPRRRDQVRQVRRGRRGPARSPASDRRARPASAQAPGRAGGALARQRAPGAVSASPSSAAG